MRDIVLELLSSYGYAGMFALILIENLFPPIPSEAILTFGGVLTTCTSMTALGVILSATAGSLAGAAILYLAGRMIPGDALERIFSGRAGRAAGFSREDVELARMWFLRRGAAAVFFCRLLPIVRSLVSIPAGMAGMRSGPFFL
uniref:DedA family protein n=1 Tax=Clostridium fessum TaxID=2126740 RepID=UPI003AEFEFF3